MATVLVIDDSKAIRELLGSILRNGGHTVLEAADGRAALDLLAWRRVELVISDLIMPKLDGLAFLKAFRRLPGCATTPVIMLSTQHLESEKRDAKILGAHTWIVKPFTAPQILDAVSRLLSETA